MRWGLCCTFAGEEIKFRSTTARYVGTLPKLEQRRFLGQLAADNVRALAAAVAWCASHGVGAFRVLSQVFQLVTHPVLGYRIDDLPNIDSIFEGLAGVRRLAEAGDVRLSFHPDQFVVPGSATANTVRQSLAELEHMAEVGERLGAVQMTIHGGGAEGGKAAALARLAEGIDQLSARARGLIALENDDRVYTLEDLLPLARSLGVPLVYDVHHHRCLGDSLDEVTATELAAQTWGAREPWVHLSSPRQGWSGAKPLAHSDYIDPLDVPRFWLSRRLTVDVEAKAKELAVLRLLEWQRSLPATRKSNRQPAR